MAGKEPAYVEALAVKDGKIALAGSMDAALKMNGGATKVVDLGGEVLLPGFLDAHSHYINSVLVANQRSSIRRRPARPRTCPASSDESISPKARVEHGALLTMDLAFGYLMAVSGEQLPSVILFRLGNEISDRVNGLLVTVTETTLRGRQLPL